MHDVADEDMGGPVASAAAGQGHLHIPQWLREQHPKFLEDGFIFFSAATAGHLHILRWLGQQPPVKVWALLCSWNTSVFLPYPRRLCLQIMVVWCDIGAYTFEQAVHNGHLHIIQWLREQEPPCPWDPQPPLEDFAAAAT